MAGDLLAEPAMTRIAKAFPALCAVSLVLPFAVGWALGGDPHGSRPHQIDPSAGLIRIFERLGWATSVHWPAGSNASKPVLRPAAPS